MSQNAVLSVDKAWNAVALEERLELISKAQAHGILCATVSMLLFSAISYGFDEVWGVAVSGLIAIMVMPLSAGQWWRKAKPELILKYLAVRSVARRYAYGFRIQNLDVLLIVRGTITEKFSSKEAQEFYDQQKDENEQESKEVWVCLLRGGIVILSESPGGAKLEFISAINIRQHCTIVKDAEPGHENRLIIQGASSSKDRSVIFESPYPGALYVLKQQLAKLLYENEKMKEKIGSI